MDPSVTTDKGTNKPSPDFNVDVSANNFEDVPTIIIDSLDHEGDLTVTPTFPNLSTDEKVVIEPNIDIVVESTNDVPKQENSSELLLPIDQPRSHRAASLLDDVKYLLKPTNSLSNPEVGVTASQEVDSAIKRRTMQFDEDFIASHERSLIDALTPDEARSLGAADRRSLASRGRRSSNTSRTSSARSRAPTMQPPNIPQAPVPGSTTGSNQPIRRTIFDHLSGLFWAFLAAYAFSIILFLTKIFAIDYIFAFFLQMVVQTIAFGIYAFYKGYNLLGPSEDRKATISRGILIGIGMLTSFLAYYYITLPDLSAIRQTQVILSIVLSIFFLHERVTAPRIIAFILTLIAIVLLIRPTTVGRSSSWQSFNLTNDKTTWIPYSSPWNSLIGIGLALCTAITYSIASVMSKIYSTAQYLHNTVLCFWSALSALIISIILVYITHFYIKDARSFPHDWRLFVGIALGLASIFVFIANQKAIKRERSSIVTLIYATDIILALFLQNIFTNISSDLFVILGCILVLTSVILVCVEVLVSEKRKKALAVKIARVANTTGQDDDKFQGLSLSKTTATRLSI